MAPIRQDSTNSFRLRKVEEVFVKSFTFSTRSLSIGQKIYTSATNSLSYGSQIRSINISNAIISGVPQMSNTFLTSANYLRGIDVARSTYFGKAFTASFTDYSGQTLPSSNNGNFNWFSEILLIGTVPIEPGPQSFFIGYGVMGLSHSWSATSVQTDGDIALTNPRMERGGNQIFIRPAANKWLGSPYDQGTTDQFIIAKISICDPFQVDDNAEDLLGGKNSQSNENESSSLQDSNFKQVGRITDDELTVNTTPLSGSAQFRNFDQPRVLNFRNSLIQGSYINVDFYPWGLSNSIISGFRYPSVRENLNIYDFYGDDLYSELNSYNCSHLGSNATPPTSYVIPEIISFTKTMGQVYFPGSFSSSGYRNYPFCGRWY